MILFRAFNREVAYTSVAVGLVVVGILAVVRLVRLLSDAVSGEIPVDSILTLLALRLATYVDLIAPLVTYLGILMVLTRWVRDNEMTVMSACGISSLRLIRPGLTICAVLLAVVTVFSLYLTPLASRKWDELLEQHKSRAEVSSIVPGLFTEVRRGGIYYVERLGEAPNTVSNVFAYDKAEGKDTVVTAKGGYQYVDERSGDRFLVLLDGHRYQGVPGQGDYRVMEYQTYALRIKQKPPVVPVVSVQGKTTTDLWAERADVKARAQMHWRISKIAFVPVVILMVLSFSYVNVRKSQLPRMATAIAMYFLYSNLLGYAHALMRRGRADSDLMLWGIHLVFAMLAVWMVVRRGNNRSLLPRLTLARGRA